MKYFQPSYTRIADKIKCKTLNSRQAEYQPALAYCMRRYAASGCELPEEFFEYNTNHAEENLRNAVRHAEEIFDTLDINDMLDYQQHKDLIAKWFMYAVYRDGKEYVKFEELWYERTWKKVTVKAATHACAVVFYCDYTAKNPDAAGLAVALDGKTIQSLKNGRLLAAQTKRILGVAGSFLKNMKDKENMSQQHRRDERVQSIDDQFIRERTETINKAAKEILGYSRYITFTGPLNVNDLAFYQRNGFFELVDFLKFITVAVRNEKAPVEYNDYDIRPVAASFDESRQIHTDIAAAISKSITPYAKARKTVK